jgi:hypothetical protein
MRLLRLTLISNNLLLIGPRLIGIVYPANSLLNARTTDHLVVRATFLPALIPISSSLTRRVYRQWAMIIIVTAPCIWETVFKKSASVFESTALVASSNISIEGSRYRTRVMPTRCCSPPEIRASRSPTIESSSYSREPRIGLGRAFCTLRHVLSSSMPSSPCPTRCVAGGYRRSDLRPRV